MFTFSDITTSLQLSINTANIAKVGSYSLDVKGHQGSYTGNEHTLTISITIVDNCPTATLSTTAIAPITYNVYAPANVVTIAPFTSSMADAICGSFSYVVQNTDTTLIDTSVFTYSSLSLTISTSDYTKTGSYSIDIIGF